MRKILKYTYCTVLIMIAVSCDVNQTSIENLPFVTTSEVNNITCSSAEIGGSITLKNNSIYTESGICWSKNTNPTIEDNKMYNNGNKTPFTVLIPRLTIGTKYYARAFASNNTGTTYGDVISFSTLSYGLISDIDGNTYKTVQIGKQTWMAENLKTTKYNDGSPIPNVTDSLEWIQFTRGAYCNYRNDEKNSQLYGRLYNWYALNSGKLAPEGWHVATDSEWQILEKYLIENGYDYDGAATSSTNSLAKALSATTIWKSSTNLGAPGNNMNSNNSSYFSAIPSGERYQGAFTRLGIFAFWWCYDESNTWYRDIQYNGVFIYRSNIREKNTGSSVRCIKN